MTVAHELAHSLKQLAVWIDAEDDDEEDSRTIAKHRDPDQLWKLGTKVKKELREVWKNPGVDVFDVACVFSPLASLFVLY